MAWGKTGQETEYRNFNFYILILPGQGWLFGFWFQNMINIQN